MEVKLSSELPLLYLSRCGGAGALAKAMGLAIKQA